MMKRSGFTLIEILIVVAIIAILASVVLVGLGPTQQSGRDARRISDLRSIQNGLELYFNKCGYYPGTGTGVPCGAFAVSTGYNSKGAGDVVPTITGSGLGITSMPDDPTSGKHYVYATDVNGTTYTLGAYLENGNNSVFNSYTPPANLANYTSGDAIGPCTQAAPGPEYCVQL